MFTLAADIEAFRHPEAYEVVQEPSKGKGARVRLTGATPQAVLHAVFEFLERQGAFFGLDKYMCPGTYTAEIHAFQGVGAFVDYYVAATFETFGGDSFRSTAHLEAPARYYTLTIT